MFENQLTELDARREVLLDEARELTRADGGLEGPDLDRFEAIEAELEQLRSKRERITRAAAGIADGSMRLESGFGGRGDGPTLLKRTDPWEAPGYSDGPAEIQTRGLAAIERVEGERLEPEHRERVSQVIRGDETSDTAEYVTAASNKHYLGAFRKVVLGPLGRADWTSEERQAWENVVHTRVARELDGEARAALTTVNSSALLPIVIDPTVIINAGGARGDFRSFSRVETIATNSWNGVTAPQVSGEWVSEASEATDATPVVSAQQVIPIRGDAYCQASWELVQDSNFAEQLGRLLGDAKYVLEQAAFATGTGGTAQPQGIVTALQAQTSSQLSLQTASSGIGLVDVYSMISNFTQSRVLDNVSWAGHWGTSVQIRQFAAAVTPQGGFWADSMQPNTPPQLLGHAYHEVSGMHAGITTGSQFGLILGDFSSGYLIVDRLGMSVTSSNWVVSSSFRPTGQWGFLGFFRTGAKCIVPAAFKILK